MLSRLKSFLLENKGARQTVTKNVFWLGVSHIGSRLIRAIIIIYAARVLGAAEYGIFSYALGLAAFFTVFADIGIGSILTKEVAQKPEEAQSYFATSFWIKAVLLILSSLLVIFLAPSFSKIELAKPLFPLIALLIVFDNFRDLTNAFFRGRERMEYEAVVMLGMNVAIAIFGLIALTLFPTPKILTISYVSGAGVGLLVGIFILKKEYRALITYFNRRLVRPILNLAWPIAITGLLGAFMLNTDILMLGWFRDAKEIGLYSAGQKIVQLFYNLSVILAGATLPAISRAAGDKDRARITLLAEKGFAINIFLALPLTVGGIILGQSIMGFLYGNEYLPGALAFQILVVTTLIVLPGALLGNVTFAYNKQKETALYVGLGALGNILLNSLLIPPLGSTGAALATLFVQAVYYGFILKMTKRLITFRIFPQIKKIVPASLLMGGVAFVLNLWQVNLIVNILTSGIVYLAVLYLSKETVIREFEKIVFKAARIKS